MRKATSLKYLALINQNFHDIWEHKAGSRKKRTTAMALAKNEVFVG